MIAQAKQRLAFVLAFLFATLPGIALADRDSVIVDCARGRSIQDALAKKNPDRPLEVVIRGACTEDVTIRRDDVTLAGDGGSISGGVTVNGARRVVITGLTITNPAGDGVIVTNGGSADISNNHIDDNAGYGIFLRHASFAIVNNNTMLRNGIINPTTIDASGIGVSLGSMVRGLQNQIGENANTGIEVFDNSTYRSEGDVIAIRASAPGRSAVDVFRASLVDLRGVTVTGQIFVDQQAQLQVRNLEGLTSTITGNIGVSTLSFLRLRAGVVRQASALSCGGGFSVCRCDGFPMQVCPANVP
jgi:parallel beta-helix repeat protein